MKRTTCSRVAIKGGPTAYVFRGSEFGMCHHRHIACLRGLSEAQPDAKTQMYFKAGNEGEIIAKEMLLELAAKDPRLVIEEYASGWQNQTSVEIREQREKVVDGSTMTREVRLICSPDGRLAFPDDFFFPDEWTSGVSISRTTRPRRFALEVKVYGKSSGNKFDKKGAASNATLEWQTSGVAAGYADFFKEDIGVVVFVLRREPILGDDGKTIVGFTVPRDQVPSVWVYDAPRYTRQECLDRCWDIVESYEGHRWVPCDNSYFCRYPHRPTPFVDVIAEATLQDLDEKWQAYQGALREAEGLLIGAQNGDILGGYAVCRQLLSVPTVRLLGA